LIDNPPFCKSFAEYVRETKTEYVKCRKTLWGSIQRILSEILLHSHQIIELPLSEFFVFLDITNKLMEIGETFSDTTSNALRDAVHEMGIRYFRNFHLNKLAEMK
jgi:hypothetical protein